MPGSAYEVRFDFFSDIDDAVTGNHDVGIKALDAKFFGVDGCRPAKQDGHDWSYKKAAQREAERTQKWHIVK